MKQILLTLTLFALSTSFSQAQWMDQRFDGQDTVDGFSVPFYHDSLFQVGPPQKKLFNKAHTAPNVLITDTVNGYPDSAMARALFMFNVRYPVRQRGILAFHWMQKLDMEAGKDFGQVFFQVDRGPIQNIFDNPEVYKLYGFEQKNVFSDPGDNLKKFSGTDTTWRNVWLCFDSDYAYADGWEEIWIHFVFTSDINPTEQEGWMIDNFFIQPTWVHTVEEVKDTLPIRIYPTVNTGRVHIKTQRGADPQLIQSIRVADEHGRVVKEHGLAPTKYWVDLDDLPNATYYVTVKTEKYQQTEKIILQR